MIVTEKYHMTLPTLDTNGLEVSAAASNIFADALGLLADKKDIEFLIAELTSLHKSKENHCENHHSHCASFFTGTYKTGLIVTEVMIWQLTALNQRLHGQIDLSYESVKKAIQIEEQLAWGYGPPIPPKPSIELYGDFLYEDKLFVESYGVFKEELVRLPNRFNALQKLYSQSQKEIQRKGAKRQRPQRKIF